MSAEGPGAIGPVSVRYAAQIRELLHAQALQRSAAAEQAARASAEAERAARIEAAAKSEEAELVAPALETEAVSAPSETARTDKADPVLPGQLIDIQA